MSQGHVELVRRYYEAFNRGAWDAMFADFSPDFGYVSPGFYVPADRIQLGPEAYRQLLAGLFGGFEDLRADVHELIDAGDQVFASLLILGRAKNSQVQTNWHVSQIWVLRDGKITGAQDFATRADALEAVGLSE